MNVHVGEMSQLSSCHRRHADYLMLRGDSDRARKELEEDLNLVRSVPVAETAFPEFALSEALTLAALGQWSGEFTPLRSPIHPQPANVDINRLGNGPRRNGGEADRLAAIDRQVTLAHTGGSSNRSMDGSRHLLNPIRCHEVRPRSHPDSRDRLDDDGTPARARWRGKERSANSAMRTGSPINCSRWPNGSRDPILIKPPPTCF